ncbi:MAG: hypothetical protein BGN97_02690 [Microbacterium sp. 69-10]|uniref:TetR/AcrR family transcriptional regulator n=1 Tax=Microbacterium sp. 69-10 TaxID=1895783 RepID=UPI000960B636|nr:TetR/AcrR family transcriptional regulator [Microbacterium sp. 69-10]OJU40230.1 MAG: hypothetical protein BGN97_02690 [Microbacterium sp. 69-10]
MLPDSPAHRTRLRLLTAASEEMIERGYAAASLSRIAARLGLTKGALGHHFPTKQDIAIAVFDRADEIAVQVAEDARRLFPDSAIRGCIAYFAGLARAGAADPIAAAWLALYQDRSVPVEIARRGYVTSRDVVAGFLADHLSRECGELRMPPAQATLFLQLLVSGELAIARFLTDYSAQNAVDSFATALTGLGVPDAEAVVIDGIQAVWTSSRE